ncbi:MAG: leucine-rich repeat protein [Firmicutes bacterium]|nr:leucine-rich repeat protein [Bacillota bacterium]
MKKRILSVLLVLCLVFTLLPVGATAAEATSGTCGSNLKWKLEGGTLTVSGTGAMYNYGDGSGRIQPWPGDSIEEVVIGSGVTSIGNYAFEECHGINSVTIGKDVKSIGEGAFYTLYGGPESITIPVSVTSIGDYAFNGWDLITVNYGGTVNQWKAMNTYDRNYFLAAAEIKCADGTVLPRGICGADLTWEIDDNGTLIVSGTGEMFDYGFHEYRALWSRHADSIKNVVIEAGVTSIGKDAFVYCDNITSVTIPASVTSIGEGAFRLCNKLSTVNYGGTANKWNAISIGNDNDNLTGANINYAGITWTYNNGTLTISGTGDVEDYNNSSAPWYDHRYDTTKIVISNGVTGIGEGAFCYFTELTSVSLPGSLKSIGAYAFRGCSSLKSVVIPDSVTSIGEGAFYRCTALTTATVSNSVSRISYGTFMSCENLISVTIPNSVKSIGEKAFYNCGSLTDVYYKGSAAQWNAVMVGLDNDSLQNANIYFVHTHSYTAAVTAPTCTARGYTTYTCSCGDSYVDNYTDRLGHDYVNGICSRCGEADPNYKLAAPELKITTSSGKPKVYWNEVDGAVKYWLYRSTDGVKFNYYDTTTSTNYTNRSTTIGTTYYYKVKAIDANDARSEFSVVKSIMCKPAAPTVSINRSNGKPKLSWKSVSGAKKYWVYRSTDGKNFKYWDSTTKTNYTNKGAASGTKYYYRVKAVAIVNGNNVASANSNTKNLITTLATPSVSITTSGGKPKLTWKAVTGADKYYIYRSTDGKNFKYWESTTKTSYINTGAKRNTRYYYKVKAVCAANSNANSARSASVSIKATK